MEAIPNPINKFNVLVVTPTPSHAPIRGNRKRILALSNRLREMGGKIYFVYFPREWGMKINDDEMRAMKSHWDEVFLVPPSGPVIGSTTEEHYRIDDWWDDNIGRTCNWLSWGVYFDIVIVNYAFFSKCFEYLNRNLLRVLDTHDVLAGRKEMLIANDLPVDFFYTTKQEEKIALERASVVLAIKPSEAAHFRALAATPVIELGHFENFVAPISTGGISAGPITFGYLASENPINQENLRRFLSAFAPVLEANPSDVRFRIAGLISDYAASLAQTRLPNVEILGRIEHVEQFYSNLCDVVVSPFDFGTGLKIKTVEALSFGKPIIGTAHAFEGISTEEPMHLYPNVRDMVEGCIATVKSPEQTIKVLTASTEAIRHELRTRFDNAVTRIVRAAGYRRFVLVAEPGFWHEQTAYQRRTAALIRQLREHAHLHIVCAAPARPDWRNQLVEWQWGISFHLNVNGADQDAFVEEMVTLLEPSICIFETPSRVALRVGCDELYLDFTALSAAGWRSTLRGENIPFATAPRILHTSDAVRATALDIPALGAAATASLPMVDADICARTGASLAIVCDDPIGWAPLVRAMTHELVPFSKWDGRGDVFVPSLNPASAAIDDIPSYSLHIREAFPKITHRIRACVHLGSDRLLATDLKAGLLNQGVPILRLASGPIANEPYEVTCSSAAELRQHLRFIFASDTIAARYAAASCEWARAEQSLYGLQTWAWQLGWRLARSVDGFLRTEAA
ncbi:MAG: glycosyltransferase [Alphaproteobacteria bacterium]